MYDYYYGCTGFRKQILLIISIMTVSKNLKLMSNL